MGGDRIQLGVRNMARGGKAGTFSEDNRVKKQESLKSQGRVNVADPHGSYLTLGRARRLSWLDLRQRWALSISEKVVKKCYLLLHFLNFL